MISNTTVQLASVRVITDDLEKSLRFYQALTGGTPAWLTDDFVELHTPMATFALSHPRRVAFITEDTPRAAANSSVIIEFLVTDVDELFADLRSTFGDELNVVQAPMMMPWGNQSALIRDPDGGLINLYSPVTEAARQLQANRTTIGDVPNAR